MQAFLAVILTFLLLFRSITSFPSSLPQSQSKSFDRSLSKNLFLELEELSRLVAISYCVGDTGIQEPFECLSHCSDFKGFALAKTWSTGILDSSSSGYIVLSHSPWSKRIIVVFRGTHSFTDAIRDLMTSPVEYLPYPVNDADCNNCTVHSGFMSSWNATKEQILPTLERLKLEYPEYNLVLAGHSLGGATAGLAALEFKARRWEVEITTFGEPRLGNEALAQYIDNAFPWNVSENKSRYHRVTHAQDPVPLLPFEKWGWRMHGGEIYISKNDLPPAVSDLERCEGDEDDRCIEGSAGSARSKSEVESWSTPLKLQSPEENPDRGWKIPPSWQMWQLLFAHREYFWRLGLCFDPQWRDHPKAGEGMVEREAL